jgi:DNA modification methylase
MPSVRFYIKPYIQPFERHLAALELEALTSVERIDVQDGQAIVSGSSDQIQLAADRLAYWESVEGLGLTRQVRREASALISRNGSDLQGIVNLTQLQLQAKAPRARCLRYGTHGLHEYRGKFFPQLVTSLLNISKLGEGALVLDPMCGSGTTLLEAISQGHDARGVDMNPLSVFVAQTKCDALSLSVPEIISAFENIEHQLLNPRAIRPTRPAADEEYLDRWFPANVLSELDAIDAAISTITTEPLRRFFRVCLSNIIRKVSHQKEADLRVRREEIVLPDGEVTAAFRAEALRSSKSLVSLLTHGDLCALGAAEVFSGDARRLSDQTAAQPRLADVVITSPPYATALPYLDTDRLSLSYLGLLSRSEHRAKDQEMIGNREISEKIRRQQWERYEARRGELPSSVTRLIDKVESENTLGEVGFRRKNLGALLSTYFFDMKDVLFEIHKALKPDAPAYLIVGNNRTRTPVGEIEIDTSSLLLDIAIHLGFRDCIKSEMEMLAGRDIFKDNRTPSEHILSMRNYA